MGNRRQRGFTIIDGLVGTMLMALTVVGLFGAWSVMFRHDGQARLISQAGQLGRAELERMKVLGADNLPAGTYTTATQTATATGAFDPTTNLWIVSGTSYYNNIGSKVSSAVSPGAALAVQDTITTYGALAGTGGYTLQPSSKCTVQVTITNVADGSVLFTIYSNLVQGGI